MSETSTRLSDGVPSQTMIVATRFHLGKSEQAPQQIDLDAKIQSFCRFCSQSCSGDKITTLAGVIAVDAEERIAGYDLVKAIRESCSKIEDSVSMHVLPVQPWGKFTPALNALIRWSADFSPRADCILFASAEANASRTAIELIHSNLSSSTLVVGAVLPGHEFKGDGMSCNTPVELTGRTTPWNTLALWNLRRLALTGFQGVSEDPSAAGVEEVVAIAVLQKIFGADNCKAKLVVVSDVEWNQCFSDPARQLWHEQKMKSKIDRAAKQLQMMGLQGIVHH